MNKFWRVFGCFGAVLGLFTLLVIDIPRGDFSLRGAPMSVLCVVIGILNYYIHRESGRTT